MSPPRHRTAACWQPISTSPVLFGLIAPLLAVAGCPASPVATEALRFACAAPSDCLPRHACVNNVCVPAAELDAGPREVLATDTQGSEGLIGDLPRQDALFADNPSLDAAGADTQAGDRSAQDLPSPADAGSTDASDAGTLDQAPADSPAPDHRAPDTPIPDSAAQDTTTPDTTQPDTWAPDTAAPDTATPDAGDPVVEAVVSGSTALPDDATTHVVTLASAVVPERSLLVFSVTTSSVNPSDGNVAGQLVNGGSQVQFRRYGTGATSVQIRYSVVELVDARVQRGTAVMQPGWSGIGPTIAAVDRSRSFALHSWMIVGVNYNGNDFYRIDLQDDTHVRIRRSDSADTATVEWQVVELPAAASTASLDFSLSTSDLGKDLSLSPPVDLGDTFALLSYEVSGTSNNDIKSNALRGHLHDASTLRLSRGDDNVATAGTVFVVSWPALDVRHGEVSFVDGESQRRSALNPAVATARSVVFAPSIQKQGETSLSESSDHIGSAWMTCELSSDGSEVIVSRGHGVGASTFSWTVVQFP